MSHTVTGSQPGWRFWQRAAAVAAMVWYIVNTAHLGAMAPPREAATPPAVPPTPPATGKAWVLYRRPSISLTWVRTRRAFPDVKSCFRAENALHNRDQTYVYDCDPI